VQLVGELAIPEQDVLLLHREKGREIQEESRGVAKGMSGLYQHQLMVMLLRTPAYRISGTEV
jgi:hypothetical protein